jgi:hypothetical protein
MVDWLQKTAGYTANGLSYDERKELEKLRQEIGAYREKDELKKGNDKHQSSSDEVYNITKGE